MFPLTVPATYTMVSPRAKCTFFITVVTLLIRPTRDKSLLVSPFVMQTFRFIHCKCKIKRPGLPVGIECIITPAKTDIKRIVYRPQSIIKKNKKRVSEKRSTRGALMTWL